MLPRDDVYEAAYEFGKKLGKVPVRTSDKTGFIVNRLLVPYLLDAIRAYEEGVGSIEDIDNAMKLGCGYPMGPFTLLDFVGLDTTYYITHVMYDEFKERRFASPPLLKRMVMAGWYGRKSGQAGFTIIRTRRSRSRRNCRNSGRPISALRIGSLRSAMTKLLRVHLRLCRMQQLLYADVICKTGCDGKV